MYSAKQDSRTGESYTRGQIPFILRYKALIMTQSDAQTIKPESGRTLDKTNLERLLAARAPGPDGSASTLYLKPGEGLEFLESLGSPGWDWRERLIRLNGSIRDSGTGLAALRSGDRCLVVAPPFPLPESRLVSSWDPSALFLQLMAEYTLGVVLLRLGRSSVAIYRGERLLSSKTDARYVKGKHHAGGTSQLRFQRIREGQMRKMYDKTCATVHRQFAPYAGKFDYIFLGGERFTLNGFLKVCPYMEQFRSITLGRRLNIRDPKRDTLDEVGGMLHESRVYQFQW